MKLLAVALSSIWLAYVLAADRVVLQMAEEHKGTPALRIDAVLTGIGDAWPEHVTFELHPDFGFRLESDRGNRWLFHADGGLQGTVLPTPPWIPDLRLLTLRDAELLRELVVATGLDFAASELVRCGEFDCFVLGGRDAPAQLWVDKDRFEILELRDSVGRRTRYTDYRSWGRTRFPAEIEILDAYGSIGTLRVENVTLAGALGADQFSPLWVSAPTEAE